MNVLMKPVLLKYVLVNHVLVNNMLVKHVLVNNVLVNNAQPFNTFFAYFGTLRHKLAQPELSLFQKWSYYKRFPGAPNMVAFIFSENW